MYRVTKFLYTGLDKRDELSLVLVEKNATNLNFFIFYLVSLQIN